MARHPVVRWQLEVLVRCLYSGASLHRDRARPARSCPRPIANGGILWMFVPGCSPPPCRRRRVSLSSAYGVKPTSSSRDSSLAPRVTRDQTPACVCRNEPTTDAPPMIIDLDVREEAVGAILQSREVFKYCCQCDLGYRSRSDFCRTHGARSAHLGVSPPWPIAKVDLATSSPSRLRGRP
jgi:hypothetical protein